MNKDTFRILKEINSLYTANQKLSELIENEHSRIHKIQNLRDDKKQKIIQTEKDLKQFSAKLLQTENSIADNQSKLNQALSNKNNVYSENEISAFEKQIASFKESIDELENKGLEVLSTCEQLSEELSDAKSFLTGSRETLLEITKEVEKISKPHIDKINIHKLRIENLFLEIPEDLKDKFQKLMKRNLKYGPTSQIQQNSCSVCRMEISRLDIEKVEKHLQIKFCSTCDRLFIPISTLYK